MAMSNKRIKDAMDNGRIVIHPFNPSYLSTSSYDVCLGENYYREQHPPHFTSLFNIYDQKQVNRIWGEPQVAMPAKEILKDYNFDYVGINPDDPIILMAPGETILAHTLEYIGGRRDVTTMMKARSSLGRSFIAVCKDAGWGDVGYINRWTMEITNFSTKYYIPLPVGERIAQIVFFDAFEAEGDYADKGNYQQETSLVDLKANWNPTMMLPRTKRTKLGG